MLSRLFPRHTAPRRRLGALTLLASLSAAGLGPRSLAAAPPAEKSPVFRLDQTGVPRMSEDAAAQAREVQSLVATVRDTKIDASERRDAACRLIRMNSPAATAAIIRELGYMAPTNGAPATAKAVGEAAASAPDAASQRIMVQALAVSSDLPPDEAASVLADLLDRAEEPLLSETAAALARCLDPQTTQQLLATASDPSAPAVRRRGAVLTLGKVPTQAVAGRLMQLIAPTQPEYLRAWAFDALAELSGIPDFGDNLTRWQQWWDQHRWLEQQQWITRLNDNYARRNLRTKLASDAVSDRVLELQRRLYRATAQADRPPLLVAMLGDTQLTTRQLGMELVVERSLLDGQAPSPELRAAIAARIDDPSPNLREKAAGLIMDLKDEPGADAVAERLSQPGESQASVLRSYLRVMKRMPRKMVIARCIDLLDDPVLRADAAGALAKALEQGLVPDDQRTALKATVHEQLPPPQPGAADTPDPAMIELLGRLAEPADWPRIRAWLGSDSEAIRTPAATAWAASDQPLSTLVLAANDLSTQRIAIEAAAVRGADAETYHVLATRKPTQEQLAQAWLRAMEKMARRVSPASVLEGDALLAKHKESWPVRDSLLSIAAEGLMPASRTQPATLTLPGALPALLTTRGELRLEHGEAAQALGDFRLVLDSGPAKGFELLNRVEAGLVQAYLAQGEIEAATKAASAALAGRVIPAEVQTRICASMLDAAKRNLAAGQIDLAKKLLAETRRLFKPLPAESLTERLASLEKQAGVEPPAEPTTQPTTAPSK